MIGADGEIFDTLGDMKRGGSSKEISSGCTLVVYRESLLPLLDCLPRQKTETDESRLAMRDFRPSAPAYETQG